VKPVAQPRTAEVSADFAQVNTLEDALQQAPDVRAEEIARATELVESRTYPPPEMIKRLARLLAEEFEDFTQIG
jgi:hypothetical protein